jgi:hypothetical protein
VQHDLAVRGAPNVCPTCRQECQALRAALDELKARPIFMMPDFPIDESEDILQEDESAESDDIPEMDE